MISLFLHQTIINIDITSLDDAIASLLGHLAKFGVRLIYGGLVYVVGRWAVSLLRKLIARILERRNVENTVSTFVNSMANWLLQLVLILIIINILGIETTSFAAIIAAGGLAIGMAMKDNLSNFAGGVMILLNKPFKLKDRIVAQGMDGTVKEIGILYTILLTSDGQTIYLPNGPLSTGSILNYTTQRDRRLAITFNINYGVDIDDIKRMLFEIIGTNPDILDSPEPYIGMTSLNNGTFDVTLRVWVMNANYSSVQTDLNEKVYRLLSRKGIFVSSTLSVKMVTE